MGSNVDKGKQCIHPLPYGSLLDNGKGPSQIPHHHLGHITCQWALQTLARCRYTSDYNDFDGDGDSDGGDLTCLYPWSKDGNDLHAEPRTSFYSDLNNCLRVLSNKCSRQNYNYIFHKKKIGKDCCRKLVEMGRECDESLIWTLTNTRGYTDKSNTIRERSYKAFERCEKAVNRDRGW
ncbi:hypothetical protein RJ639_044470 [Escallonia herrerae]|uniref:Prolamin-like domain-containing protein n=1 Tax=Escallonia herrerae TaxID=1293975 RepID=A0AA89B7U0_9ASTE|nr:hypothetical protein RJ639_044470 [Escallonia herrerae]